MYINADVYYLYRCEILVFSSESLDNHTRLEQLMQ